MSALQLQNLATLAAAAAVAQNSASPSNANPLSASAASLGALGSPGNTAVTQVGGGGRGSDAGGGQRLPPLSTVTIVVAPALPPPSLKTINQPKHLHCSDRPSVVFLAHSHGVCIHRFSDLHLHRNHAVLSMHRPPASSNHSLTNTILSYTHCICVRVCMSVCSVLQCFLSGSEVSIFNYLFVLHRKR